MLDLSDADPLPRLISWLNADPAVTGLLGGTDRVGYHNEAPFPRIRLVDIGGDDRDLRWLYAPQIQVEALGDLDGTQDKAALRRVLYAALSSLQRLPWDPVGPGDPVITSVGSARGGGWVPEPSGQGRYLAVVTLTVHPPQAH